MKTEKKNLAICRELLRRGLIVQNDATTPPNEKRPLLNEIVFLGQRARAGGVPREDWENHELNWMIYCATIRHSLVHALAKTLIEAEENCDGSLEWSESNQDIGQLLYWWQNDGGREELLGELPIEERRALEKRRR